ncbi:aspartate aminotransferase family protein [Candidatus Pantoea edessiphila]|uniref:Acetylornithine/succinyldiaminopimelate aminotransferase n=1 Tax=Candidatus Pantoea edessiphila TaxID=2044610 RepID=A0A2P5SYT8_9GAMM|nr:bifunctional succinylornithine transaminase/acetylornithine transaminase [Candidatus Pantoea edessiphila]MBK4775373.1 acetylornithine/succinylornithine family transaminase [Pantoea sp. Edef]PPI87496.1 aspartate aminotransferase family protein [Candidatus Pantoea edessiphila]
MSIKFFREDFDKWMIPVYNPAKFIPVRAKGSIVWDQNGKDYIDFTGGIAVNVLGHCHPLLKKTLQKQADNLWHIGNSYTNEPILGLAKKLVDLTFADKVFFCNSGAEANETALKLARKVARDKFGKYKNNILAFKNSFHGRTFFTVATGGKSCYSKYFEPLPKEIQHASFNDISSVTKLINENTCAVIIEPIQGEGGVNPADFCFLKQLRALCDKYHVLLIFDEVQTGIGRTGELYAYMYYKVIPDILTSAKGLGGGFPIGAILTTKHLALTMTVGTHGSTYGGNPLAGALASKVLELIKKDKIMDGVAERHMWIVSYLKKINQNLNIFKEIRGIGLLIGAVLNKKLAYQASKISIKASECGVMVLVAGSNVIRFTPALNISKREINIGMKRFSKACNLILGNN